MLLFSNFFVQKQDRCIRSATPNSHTFEGTYISCGNTSTQLDNQTNPAAKTCSSMLVHARPCFSMLLHAFPCHSTPCLSTPSTLFPLLLEQTLNFSNRLLSSPLCHWIFLKCFNTTRQHSCSVTLLCLLCCCLVKD